MKNTLLILISLAIPSIIVGADLRLGPTERLREAASTGDIKALRNALATDADPDDPDRYGNVALFYACKWGQGNAVQILAPLTSTISMKEVLCALKSGNAHIVRATLEAYRETGKTFEKEPYLAASSQTENPKLLVVGLVMGIVHEEDLTPELLVQFIKENQSGKKTPEDLRKEILEGVRIEQSRKRRSSTQHHGGDTSPTKRSSTSDGQD